ncbi:MAG: chemotaxis-specific protein-glutamate methyltransferase CheB [Arcobacteraceae bacterium]|nr:chemotaxis-specific protein-glutamate methyltransferase CheB [Arcobacteraceae bacterium]
MIKVFIIDDSMMVRNAIFKILKGEKDIKIIGEAPNPVDAFEVFRKVGLPDVFILDIEMPKMDGLTFLKQIQKQKPIPVIICSTLVHKGSSEAIDALRLGAVDIVLKPKINVKEYFIEQKDIFLNAIRGAALSKVNFSPSSVEQKEVSQKDVKAGVPSKDFIAIGSSTGGVQVLEEILTKLKPSHLGIVITQHMPEGFTSSFSNRLNNLTKSLIVEAKDGEVICENKVIIAKGGIHMEVIKDENDGFYKIRLRDFPKVNSHRPSVNVLFSSISKVVDKNVTAFILTGMGDDGAVGLKKLKDKGCDTYGQNKQTCVVYGMPNIANQIGAVKSEMSIFEIIKKINSLN